MTPCLPPYEQLCHPHGLSMTLGGTAVAETRFGAWWQENLHWTPLCHGWSTCSPEWQTKFSFPFLRCFCVVCCCSPESPKGRITSEMRLLQLIYCRDSSCKFGLYWTETFPPTSLRTWQRVLLPATPSLHSRLLLPAIEVNETYFSGTVSSTYVVTGAAWWGESGQSNKIRHRSGFCLMQDTQLRG